MALGPVASSRTSVARSESSHGTEGAGASRPSRLSASREMGRSRSAATAANRRLSDASPVTSAPSDKTTSSSVTPMPGSTITGVCVGAERRSRRRPDRVSWARDHAVRRRQASSPSQATVRPAVATASISASESARSMAAATCSCSWSKRVFRSRPARRCSATRAAVRTARASATATVSMRSAKTGTAAIRATRAPMSRRPPWDSLRSGSRRNPTSPLAACRSATRSDNMPSHGGFWLTQRSRAPSMTDSATDDCPQMTRASRRPRATFKSSPAMSRASLGRRTLWSRAMPSSHTGYQIRSATVETSLRPLWISTTSRSLKGQSSRRP